MRIGKRSMAVILIVTVLFGSVACSFLYDRFDSDQTYSVIMDDAYKSKADIDPEDKGLFMKTVAGVIKSIGNGDSQALRGFLCDGLLAMDDTDSEIGRLTSGFKGTVRDTTPIWGDLRARGYARWSKSEPIACYDGWCYIYTDDQTYYLYVSMCSVNKKDPDGDDSVGVCMIELMTLDMKYGLDRSDNLADGDRPPEYVSVYKFPGGVTKDVTLRKAGSNYCGIVSAYGDGTGYVIIDTAVGYSYNVYRLTGTSDEVDLDEVKALDYGNMDEVYEFFASHEEYAEGEGFNHFYNIKGSDDKLLVWIHGENNDDTPDITGVQVIDVTKPYGDQKRTEIYKK